MKNIILLAVFFLGSQIVSADIGSLYLNCKALDSHEWIHFTELDKVGNPQLHTNLSVNTDRKFELSEDEEFITLRFKGRQYRWGSDVNTLRVPSSPRQSNDIEGELTINTLDYILPNDGVTRKEYTIPVRCEKFYGQS